MGDLERDFIDFRERGSPKAMARVFDSAAPELLLVAGHLARDANAAEDLVQGTFLAAIEHRQRFDPSRRMMPWLLGILVNLHRSDRRRKGQASIPKEWPAAGRDPAGAAEDAELAERLSRVLASMPTNYGEPLRLRLVHGLEPVQIAHALGRPLETVRTQLRRGKELLREALPASMVGAFTLDFGLGSESLAAMREAVLAHAVLAPATSGALAAALGGAIVMKKLLVVSAVLVLAGASYVLTRASHGVGPSSPVTLAGPTSAEEPPDAEQANVSEVLSQDGRTAAPAALPEAEDAPEPTPPQQDADAELIAEFRSAIEASLFGRFDAGAILDLALLVVNLEADDRAIPEPDPSGRMSFPILGTPPGITATLSVTASNNSRYDKMIGIDMSLERSASPVMLDGALREGPSARIYVWTGLDGDVLDIVISTSMPPDINATEERLGVSIKEGTFVYGVNLHLDPDRVERTRAKGLKNGKPTSWEAEMVIVGGDWPRHEDLDKFSKALLKSYDDIRKSNKD